MSIFRRFIALFRSSVPVPAELRGNFLHLYLEIAWFGIVNGTTASFLSVYATRQGASPFQIGLLSAAPALVNLMFALPAANWLGKRPLGKATFWTSIAARIFYAVMVFLPVLLDSEAQVWMIILITLLMSIPATALVVGFNSMFGEAVPIDWRGQVVGVRNAILALVTVLFTLLSGQILNRMAFPDGYQVVFALGVLGALMSSVHIYLLARSITHRRDKTPSLATAPQPLQQAGEAGKEKGNGARARSLYQRGKQTLRLDVMNSSFAKIMALLFFWHTAQFLCIPLFTPYVVNDLNLNDSQISLANSLFNVTVFLGSLRLSSATRRFGNKTLTGVGILGLACFPLITAASTGLELYAFANLVGGLAWAMAGGALYNFVLECSPDHDRPAHLAWYSLVSNAAILLGSMAGPALVPLIGIRTALVLFGIARFLAGLAILKWG